MYGKAEGLKVKTFADYTDGCIEQKLNKFLQENPKVTIVDIKYFNGYGVVSNDESESYGRETALLVYRKF